MNIHKCNNNDVKKNIEKKVKYLDVVCGGIPMIGYVFTVVRLNYAM